MSYKPTNEDVIAYLYGEMEESERAQIDQYIAEHPEFRTELEEMEGTRVLIGQLEDEEVPSPMTFMAPSGNSEWLYWRKYVAIAASFLLLLTMGKISGINISYDEDGLQAGFGTIQKGLDAETVNQMLQADRSQLVDWVEKNLESVQEDFSGELQNIQASMNEQRTQRPEVPSLSDEDVNKLLDLQKRDLTYQMAQLSEKLTDDYKEIFKELYVNFSDNLETKRLDDLRNIQTAFDNFENATQEKQEEVEDALFNLSREVNGLIESQNNNDKNN